MPLPPPPSNATPGRMPARDTQKHAVTIPLHPPYLYRSHRPFTIVAIEEHRSGLSSDNKHDRRCHFQTQVHHLVLARLQALSHQACCWINLHNIGQPGFELRSRHRYYRPEASRIVPKRCGSVATHMGLLDHSG